MAPNRFSAPLSSLMVDPVLQGAMIVFLTVFFSFVIMALWRSKILNNDSIFTARNFELLCIYFRLMSAEFGRRFFAHAKGTAASPSNRSGARGLVSHTQTCYNFTTCLGRKIYFHLNFLDLLRQQGKLILNMDELGQRSVARGLAKSWPPT